MFDWGRPLTMSATPETQDILQSFARNLTQFPQNVEVINQGNARAVQDLSHSVTQLVETTSTSIAQTQEQLGAVFIALQNPLHAPAPDLTPLLTQLVAQQVLGLQPAEQPDSSGKGPVQSCLTRMVLLVLVWTEPPLTTPH